MTLYTVVVCPNCEYARVVVRHPQRTTCGRCQSSRQFESLRHYYQSEDKDAASQVRGAVQAQINGLSDDYEAARERGVIQQTVESVVSDDEYLQKKGADVEAIESAGERAEQATQRTKSKREIMNDAIRDHGESRESVIEYATEHGVEEDWAATYLNRALANGGVTGGRDGPFRLL